MKNALFITLVLFLAACGAREEQTVAHILQRRLDENGKLMISYRFSAGGKWVYDSMELHNQVIPHDSLQVVFSSQNPDSSRLLIP